jgi:hypothetical protein
MVSRLERNDNGAVEVYDKVLEVLGYSLRLWRFLGTIFWMASIKLEVLDRMCHIRSLWKC